MYYLIMCRSLTYAQRISSVLERAGITTRILRAPAEISRKGCGYSVKIGRQTLSRALPVLRQSRLPFEGIDVASPDYGYREVEL